MIAELNAARDDEYAEVLKTDFFGPYADVRLRAPEGIVVTARCPGHLVPAIGTASE